MISFLDCCIAWARFNSELDPEVFNDLGPSCDVSQTDYSYDGVTYSVILAYLPNDSLHNNGILLAGRERENGVERYGLLELPIELIPKVLNVNTPSKRSYKGPVTKSALNTTQTWRVTNLFLQWRLKNNLGI